MAINQARFYLHIPAEDYLAYYQGAVKYVMVTAHDGSSVQFSAHLLRPFVSHEGVHGEFVMRYDEHHKLVGLERVGR
jgi:hypothetical protein